MSIKVVVNQQLQVVAILTKVLPELSGTPLQKILSPILGRGNCPSKWLLGAS